MTRAYYMDFCVSGADRKALTEAIAEYTGEDKKYLGAPSMAYEVGNYLIEKDGTVSTDEPDRGEIMTLIGFLATKGFISQVSNLGAEEEEEEQEENLEPEEEPAEPPQNDQEEPLAEERENIPEPEDMPFPEQMTGSEGKFIVSVPRAGLTDTVIGNVKKITESRAGVLKKVLDTDSLEIEVTDDLMSFPWFTLTGDPDEAQAYIHLIDRIIRMAKSQNRITAQEHETESERYTFRCFLVRLGFVGKEYKAERRILLRNLKGSAAFPTKAAAEKFASDQKAKRLAAKEVAG